MKLRSIPSGIEVRPDDPTGEILAPERYAIVAVYHGENPGMPAVLAGAERVESVARRRVRDLLEKSYCTDAWVEAIEVIS